jgi:phosphoribosylformylglycinamidine cyclo-ligase
MTDVVMAPTRIYVKSMLALIAKIKVKGMAHITGGGLVENVPRVLPENTQAVLHRDAWQLPQLFQWLQKNGGVEDAEMHRVFNCGVGMVVILNAADAKTAKAQLESTGETVYELGEIVERPAGAHQTIVI